MAKLGALRLLAEVLPIALMGGAIGISGYLVWLARERGRPVASSEVRRVESPVVVPPEPPKPKVAKPSNAPAFDPALIESELSLLDARRSEADQARDGVVERIEAIEAAARQAQSETERMRARTLLMREQENTLRHRAAELDSEVAAAQTEIEERALERDVTRRGLEDARRRASDSYAVVPFQASNGTWREPIVLDCSAASVRVLPDGRAIPINEMDGLFARRSHPLTAQVRMRAEAIEAAGPHAGSRRAAYILFLIRPDGIRAYYEARALLESLGIAFGYELVGQDWNVEAPDLSPSAAPTPRSLASEPPSRAASSARPITTPAVGEDELHVWNALNEEPRAGQTSRGTGSAAPSSARSLEPRLDRGSNPAEPELDGFTEIIPGSSERLGAARSVAGVPGRDSTAALDPDAAPELPNPRTSVSRNRAQAADLSSLPDTPGVEGGGGGDRSVSALEHAPDAPKSLGGLGSPESEEAQRLDVVVVCRPHEVVIQPGGYRITKATLTTGALLVDRLRSIGERPGVRPHLKFVVEPGGEALFWDARRLTTYAGLDWPTTLQVSEGGVLRSALSAGRPE